MGGINKFDSAAQDKYFNTYVPLPYEQLMNTVVGRQGQLDKEQNMLSQKFDETKNLRYIAGTKDEQYVKDYINNVSQLVDKYYTADLSNPVVKQQLRREFNSATDRTRIQDIQSSHANWMQNSKIKAQLKAEGLYDQAIDEDPANADFSSENGVYQYTTQAYKNPRPAAETYFNNIKPSSTREDSQYWYEGVTPDKVNTVADAKWNEFANTSDGRLYVKKIAKENGLDYTDDNVRKQIATEYLKGVGEEFVYENRGGVLPSAKPSSSDGSGVPFNPYAVTPLTPAPTESVLSSGKKFTADHVRTELGSLNESIPALEEEINLAKQNGVPQSATIQSELNLQSLKDKQKLLQVTVDDATVYSNEQFKPRYDDAETTFKEAASRKNIDYNKAKKEYDKYQSLQEIKKYLRFQISAPGIPNASMGMEQPLNILGDIGAGIANISTATISAIGQAAEMYPEFKNNLSKELDKVSSGDISFGEALKNSFKENYALYKDFIKNVPIDKEAYTIDKDIREDVIKYYNKVNKIDKNKNNSTDEYIEKYGIKGIESTRILAPTMSVDENQQMYYLVNDKNGAVDKIINPMSTVMRNIKTDPTKYPIIQESSPVKGFTKDKNKEIQDLQESIRMSPNILPSEFEHTRNDDGTYDMYIDTFDDKGNKNRKIKVRLTEPTQIQAAAQMVKDSGHRIEAAMIADPRIEWALKANKNKPKNEVEPYPGYGKYSIVKQDDGGWKVLDPDNKPIRDFDNKEVGVIYDFNDVIYYMYNVRTSLAEKINSVNN